MIAWLRLNALLLATTLGTLAVILRTFWRAFGPRVRARWPRVGHGIDALGAISPDLVVFAKALWGVWTGTPWVDTSPVNWQARPSTLPTTPTPPPPT